MMWQVEIMQLVLGTNMFIWNILVGFF